MNLEIGKSALELGNDALVVENSVLRVEKESLNRKIGMLEVKVESLRSQSSTGQTERRFSPPMATQNCRLGTVVS